MWREASSIYLNICSINKIWVSTTCDVIMMSLKTCCENLLIGQKRVFKLTKYHFEMHRFFNIFDPCLN